MSEHKEGSPSATTPPPDEPGSESEAVPESEPVPEPGPAGGETLFGYLRRTAVFQLAMLAVTLTLLTLLLVFLVGALGTNLIGRRILKTLDKLILRIPLVKSVYGAAQQLMQSIRFSHHAGFSRVVLVEYPRRGIWTMGFLTHDYPGGIDGFGEGELVAVGTGKSHPGPFLHL